MNLQIDSTNIMRVFDKWTYLLILASVLTVTLVFLLLSYCQHSFTSPSILPETLLYVVSAFFQETYPVSKIPQGGMKVPQFNIPYKLQAWSKLLPKIFVPSTNKQKNKKLYWTPCIYFTLHCSWCCCGTCTR